MPLDNSSHENGSSDGSRTTAATAVNRRRYLQLAGVGLLAGAAGVPSVAASDDEYDVVLDVVDDLGADNTGTDAINDVLEIVDEHDSLKLVFPEGEYLLENGPGGDGFARWDFGAGDEEGRVGKLALVGDGDVTLTPPDGGRHNILTLWGEELHIENFTVDQTADDTSTGITTVAEDQLLIKDIHYDGKVTGDYVEVDAPGDPAILDDPTCLIPGLLHEDGVGLVENVRAPDGAASYSRKGAVWVNFLHAGDLLFNRCEFSNFSDNALYGSPPGQGPPLGQGGSVRVENCFFKNNNITAIRLGTPGSYAKNCVVVTEEGEIPATPWGAITSRAGWVWYNFDGYYENIDVIHDHPSGEGILDHGDNTRNLNLDVRNCRFELNNDGAHAIRFSDPGVESLTVRNLNVTGDGGYGEALEFGNADIDVRNVCVAQSGDERDGITLANVSGTIVNANIDVSGERITGDEDGVRIQTLRDSGSCSMARRRDPLA